MANFLNKLGRFMATHKLAGVFIWVLIIASILTPIAIDPPTFSNEIKMDGIKSLDTNEKIEDKYGIDGSKATIRIVLKSNEDGEITNKNNVTAVTKMLEDIKKNDKHVDKVSNPYEMKLINKDQSATYADVTFDTEPINLNKKSIDKVKDEVKELKEDTTLQIELTGSGMNAIDELGVTSEVIGISVAFIILMITFASLIAAGMPIISALIGLISSVGIIGLLTHIFEIPNITMTLAVMIGLALGIDYALFILYRYREIKKHERDHVKAIGLALGTAGGAVVFAGITVMIAVCGLSLVGIKFLSVMGLASALSVLFAVLTSLTLVPTLISVFHKQIEPKAIVTKEKNYDNFWSKFVLGKPWIAALLGLVFLGGLIIPVNDMRLGIPDDGMKSEDSTQRKAYQIISDEFGEGYNGVIPMLIKTTADKDDPKALQSNVKQVINDINNMDHVDVVSPPQMTKDNNYALITIVPEKGPNAKSTNELAKDLRDYNKDAKDKFDYQTEISGLTVINIDMSKKLNDAIPLFAGVIICLAFVLLMIVFRSLLIPLIAVIGFLLSLLATLGFTTLVMQQGVMSELFGIDANGPLLAFLPVITIGLLFGLAMDYEVFLMSRVHEEYSKTKNNLHSLKVGIKESGPVIVAAALIMFSVFISFVFQDDVMIKSMGIALAFGVLFDAFIVRLMIVPALTLLFGKASWYLPKWLDRILPVVDIEGHNLMHDEVEMQQTTSNVSTIYTPSQKAMTADIKDTNKHSINETQLEATVHTNKATTKEIEVDKLSQSELLALLKQQSNNIKDLNTLIEKYMNN